MSPRPLPAEPDDGDIDIRIEYIRIRQFRCSNQAPLPVRVKAG